jgi:hypothetical protein
MDIVKALRKEEAKLETTAKNALNHLEALRVSIRLFATGLIGNGRPVKKRGKMSAAGKLAISNAAKRRWAKFHAGKVPKPRRKISAAGRASIVKAQRAKSAKVRSAKPTRAVRQHSKMSAVTRAKMAKAQRARWTKVREARINVA